MKKYSILASLILPVLIGLSSCVPKVPPTISIKYNVGEITKTHDIYGRFYSYLPNTLTDKTEILVLVHGTPKDLSPEQNAEYFIASWLDFAEEYDYILIAPAFDQENFSSRYGDHAMGGYRGLFGRVIGADEWVIRLVEAHRQVAGTLDGQFNLYGHSAGGQFVARFLVRHPGFVEKAVITSAATYPQPNVDVKWPFGMDELHATIEWDENTTKREDVVPDKQKWLDATQIPLTVIVGMNDTSELPQELIPGQIGKNRNTIARNWVQDMKAFAESNGAQSNFTLVLVPGIGHSMSLLLPYSQAAILSR